MIRINESVGRECPDCGGRLIYRESRKGNVFVGCSRFPRCKYTEPIGIVDYLSRMLTAVGETIWYCKTDGVVDEMLEMIAKYQSKSEVRYLLGVAYYFDHYDGNYWGRCVRSWGLIEQIELSLTYVLRKGERGSEYAIGFSSPQDCIRTANKGIAFLPQMEFAEHLHHDFGVFTSDVSEPKADEWEFRCAVEVDIHPSHELQPWKDEERDALVNYPVFRLKRDDDPRRWFNRITKFLGWE